MLSEVKYCQQINATKSKITVKFNLLYLFKKFKMIMLQVVIDLKIIMKLKKEKHTKKKVKINKIFFL